MTDYVMCVRLGQENPALVFSAVAKTPEEAVSSISEETWATFWEKQGTYEADKDALCVWVQKYDEKLHKELLEQLAPV
jgi:Fe-S cluster biosynthesis and repair protein YggX